MNLAINPKAAMNQLTTNAQIDRPLLQKGDRGKAVEELQKLLAGWAIYQTELSVNGIFDTPVEKAVKIFQHRVFLRDDGIVNQSTWQALYSGTPVNMPVLKRGSACRAVITLQRVLQIAGDYQAAIDGDFSGTTDEAVRSFQKRSGLVVDGIVGFRTWHALSQVSH